MRRSPHPEPGPRALESRIFASTEALIGADGLFRLTLETVAEVASLETARLAERFPNVESLVFSVALRLTREQVICVPGPTTAAALSVEETAERLAECHRGYVAERPSRFAALHELGGAALFDFPSLRRPLADRNRRTRGALVAHLEAAYDVDPAVDLPDLAATLVGTFNGIELCFLDDADSVARDAAYREAVVAVGARLTKRGIRLRRPRPS